MHPIPLGLSLMHPRSWALSLQPHLGPWWSCPEESDTVGGSQELKGEGSKRPQGNADRGGDTPLQILPFPCSCDPISAEPGSGVGRREFVLERAPGSVSPSSYPNPKSSG